MPVTERTQATIDAMNTTDWRGLLSSQQDTINRLNEENGALTVALSELKRRQELIWADKEILGTFGKTELERYAQMSPPEMFSRLLRMEQQMAQWEKSPNTNSTWGE